MALENDSKSALSYAESFVAAPTDVETQIQRRSIVCATRELTTSRRSEVTWVFAAPLCNLKEYAEE